MDTLELLVLVQACCAWFMTGLIWVIQLVHYPLMARVGEASWVDYQRSHMSRISWIVAPVMLIEAASCGLELAMMILGDSQMNSLAGTLWAHGLLASLLLVVWCSTWLLQVPAHHALSTRIDTQVIRRLVVTNWVRTVAWSTRAVVLGLMLGSLISR